jgi:uncharacterized protein YkwD
MCKIIENYKDAPMTSKFRLLGMVAMLWLLLSLSAAEHGVAANTDRVVYLPLIFHSEPPEELTFEEQVVALTNQQRLAHGCDPVSMETRLRVAAQGHSADMALNDFFSHTGSNGSSPWDRILAQGYSFSTAGENIAAGYPSPESVVAGWMNSSGHRANILDCGFIHIGVGYYYLQNDTGNVNYHHYWTQVLAAP